MHWFPSLKVGLDTPACCIGRGARLPEETELPKAFRLIRLACCLHICVIVILIAFNFIFKSSVVCPLGAWGP